ncbi:MAG: hypothetical protein WDO19_30325 [Bacteroidota bacterium]
MEQGKIKYEFSYGGKKYLADIRHFLELSPQEIKMHGVTENTYLVHLFSPTVVKTFELFIEAGDMSMTWKTKSDLIDPAICEIIGKEIDNVHM